MIKTNSRLELLFVLYDLGRRIKSHSKKGNHDYVLQTLILRTISARSIDVTELSSVVCANLSSVSEVVDKMCGEGLLIKQSSDSDKRKTALVLSKQGRDLLLSTQKLMMKHCVNIFNNLNEQDIENLLITLKKIQI